MFSAIKESFNARPGYSSIQSDVFAGLTVGLIALPLSMALAIASGVSPQHGLYTAIVAGIVIAVSGGSKVNISGPTAAFVVVLLPVVQHYGLGGLLISGFLAGVVLIMMGLGKLGSLIEIVPYPVTVGFTAGIGVVIATLQIKDFLGLDIPSLEGHYIDKVIQLADKLPSANLDEFTIGAVTLVVLVFWPKLRLKIPGHIIALAFGSLAAWMLGKVDSSFSIATIGSRFHYELNGVTGSGIPPVLPAFEWPWNLPGANGKPVGLSFELVRQLLPSVIAIAMLGAIESLLCAVVSDGMSGKRHNPNDELIGQGIGNLIVPFFGGIPATAAIARTAASVRSGARSPLASVVHGLFILFAILALSKVLAYIPMASLAALLMMVAWNMSETKHFVRILRVAPRDDVVVLCICFSLTVLFDMTVAVGVGMGLAAILFIRRSIHLATTRKVELKHEIHGEVPNEVVIYDIDGPLFFGSAHKAIKSISDVLSEKRVVILDMSEVSMLDMSAIIAMESIAHLLVKHKVVLIMNNLQPRMVLKLRRAGIRLTPGTIEYSRSLEEAIRMAKKLLGSQRSLPAKDRS